MKTINYYLLLFLFVIFLSSCEENPVEPSIPSDIQNFVNKLELEDAQEIEIIIEVKTEDVYVFSVAYGPPMDCPSGCIYSGVWGLKNKAKISIFELYDIESIDTYLFSQEFFDIVKEKEQHIYYNMLLPLLAKDEDTPRTVLLFITEILYDYISTYIAYNLLDNPVVQADIEILTLLSELPVFQGDSYENIREIAKNLLNG